MVTSDRGGFRFSGPFQVGADGLLTAELDVTLADPAAVLKSVTEVFPALAEFAETLGVATALLPKTAGSRVRFPLTVRRGEVALGVVPVGRLPAFF